MALGYDPLDFAHSPRWALYERITATWFGFDAIRLPFTPEMYLIPLFGHTQGHCGVAIRDGDGWLFQCADALPTNAEFDLTPQWLNRPAIGPHVPRLRVFAEAHPDVRILAGHMWQSFFEN
jgi:glyoxylase-like metal-dependent hydrolase (beta-lactamase superfamily II)